MNGSNYVKSPLRSSAIQNYESDDKYFFVWLVLASLHSCEKKHPKRISRYFNEMVLMN